MLANFVCETANAPGTSSNVNLAGAVSDRLTFAQAFSSGDTPFYAMDDSTQAEIGIGLFTSGSPNVLTRSTVLWNSAGTKSRLNFIGDVRVYNWVPAEKMPYLDAAGVLRVAGAVVARQIVSTYTPSGAAAQAFPLSTAFRRFRLTLQNVTVSSAGAILLLQFSSDGGATWLTASSYTAILTGAESGGGPLALASLVQAGVVVSAALSASATASPWDAEMTIWPGTASAGLRVHGSGFGLDSSTQAALVTFAGGWGGSPALMNYARVIPSSGNLSGTLILEALP